MPSIPQSLLWISLVVLWLFVLVPMLVSRRDAVRRTSDVALATRVLTSGTTARLLKRGGPAAGHRSDPDWQHAEDVDEDADEYVDESEDADEDADEDQPSETASVGAAAAGEQAELDYLDVDVIDEGSGSVPADADVDVEAGTGQADSVAEAEAELEIDDSDPDAESDPDADAGSDAPEHEYEYVEDTSGLEIEADSQTAAPSFVSPQVAARRRGYDSTNAAAISTRKYEFRKRVLMSLAVVMALSAAAAFTVAPTAWWLCGSAAGVTVLYLAYLRRQTRIEAQVRARRARRTQRTRVERDSVSDAAFEVVPSRLRRPGVAVLDIDDEDPVFEHLEYAPFAREYGWRGDLPRAAGQ